MNTNFLKKQMDMDAVTNGILSSDQSETGKFKLVHHSTASVITLIMDAKNGFIGGTEFWMDYEEFKELCNFIKKLSDDKK